MNKNIKPFTLTIKNSKIFLHDQKFRVPDLNKIGTAVPDLNKLGTAAEDPKTTTLLYIRAAVWQQRRRILRVQLQSKNVNKIRAV